jgi:hypothetical protein
MAKVFGPSGVRGVDIGSNKYDADKKGFIEINNSKDLAQAKANGFTEVGTYSGMNVKGYPCTGCGFNSVFKIYKCWKCETENDHRD